MAGNSRSGGADKAQPPGKARHASRLKPGKRDRRSITHGTDANTPLTEIRQKIRALEKLLAYDTEKSRSEQDANKKFGARSMPSHIRQEKERALAGHKHDLQLALEKRTRTQQHSKMISKYHHIRFFERKKAERRLKQAKAAFGRGEASEETVLRARIDLNYTLYHPLEEKYVSLWPRSGEDDPDKVRSGNSWRQLAAMWADGLGNKQTEEEIEQEMLRIRDNGWPDELEDSSRISQDPTPHMQNSKATTMQASKKEKRVKKVSESGAAAIEDRPQRGSRKANVESDSDSDGFFER